MPLTLTMCTYSDGIETNTVDKGITMARPQGTLFEFAHRYFGENRGCDSAVIFSFRRTRRRISRGMCLVSRSGAAVCAGTAAGLRLPVPAMTHPRVAGIRRIDSKEYTSFAFGFGVDRLTPVTLWHRGYQIVLR